MYKIVGYYICEKLDIPNFLGIRGDELISVSGCFSGIHPDLTYCYFINDRKNERIEYHEKWNITEEKAIELQKDIHSIFESCLAIDGRFLNLEDAKKIREKYFTTSECMIVSVSTTEEYYEILTEELSESSCGINNFFSGEIDSSDIVNIG